VVAGGGGWGSSPKHAHDCRRLV
jgi:hypothetical protein